MDSTKAADVEVIAIEPVEEIVIPLPKNQPSIESIPVSNEND
jgi:hypothetical protein